MLEFAVSKGVITQEISENIIAILFEQEWIEKYLPEQIAKFVASQPNPRSLMPLPVVFINKVTYMDQRDQRKEYVEATGSIVNYKSKLEKVTQTISSNQNLESADREEFKQLVEELYANMKDVPDEEVEKSDVVIGRLEAVVNATNENNPKKSWLTATSDGLVEAASALGAIVPSVLVTAEKIAAFILDKFP